MVSYFGFIGVDWGHIPMPLPVLDKQGSPTATGEYVKSHTSMSAVVPAWRLSEFLNTSRFKEQRMADEESGKSRIASDPSVAMVDFASAEQAPPSSGENPTHREDFMRLVGAAAQKPPRAD
jgi:hypothetical protein